MKQIYIAVYGRIQSGTEKVNHRAVHKHNLHKLLRNSGFIRVDS